MLMTRTEDSDPEYFNSIESPGLKSSQKAPKLTGHNSAESDPGQASKAHIQKLSFFNNPVKQISSSSSEPNTGH